MMDKYDVIVLGGGPGGSTVSTLLADSGKKVLLLEKDTFPRYHIGESLLSGTADLMKKIGVLEKVEADGYVKKWGVEWLWGKERDSWTVYFKDALAMPHDHGYQVERAEFDKLLLDNAIEHGVEVLQPCPARDIIQDANGRVIGVKYCRGGSSNIEEAYGKFVVDATGQGGFATKRLNAQNWDPRLKNMAIWSYWKNAKKKPGIDEGNTFLPTFSEGWWWFIPLRNDVTSIGAVVDRENYEKVKSMGFAKFYADAIKRTPALAERLTNAEMCEEVRVQRDWSYAYDRFYGNGFIALGDAACFIDPLFSTGVHLAMLGGFLASVTLNTILDKPNEYDEAQLLDFYQRQVESEYKRLRAQVYFLYSGHEGDKESYFWSARNQFGVPEMDPQKAFISLIAGAFEHRSWYHRYMSHLQMPDHLRSLFEGRFNQQYSIGDNLEMNAPIAKTNNWSVFDDFAIDGKYLRTAQSLRFADGATLPFDEIYSAILQKIDGKRNFHQIRTELGRELDVNEDRIYSCLDKLAAYGALSNSCTEMVEG